MLHFIASLVYTVLYKADCFEQLKLSYLLQLLNKKTVRFILCAIDWNDVIAFNNVTSHTKISTK